MRALRVVAVEDEELAQIYLVNILKKHDFIDLVAVCDTNDSARTAILQQVPDLLILDIRIMGELVFKLLDSLRDRNLNFQILFVSAHFAEYIEESIQACQHIYKWSALRKPVKESDLIERCKFIHKGIQTEEIDRMIIKTKNGVSHVLYKEILFFEAWGNDSKLVKTDGKTYFPPMNLKKLESELPEERFYRISSKHMINREHLRELKVDAGKYLCYLNKTDIALPIPIRQWQKVKQDLYGE